MVQWDGMDSCDGELTHGTSHAVQFLLYLKAQWDGMGWTVGIEGETHRASYAVPLCQRDGMKSWD